MEFLEHVSVVPWWLWGIFTIGVVVLLIIDLSLFGKVDHTPTRKAAVTESAVWIGLALMFNLWFATAHGHVLGLEFLTGYLVEKSLSVDNLFVILLIFESLKISPRYQHRVLFYGVLGAIVLRAVFILAGAQLVHEFHWVMYLFGMILVGTAVKFLRESEEEITPEKNIAVRMLKKIVPIADSYKGKKFFVVQNGARMATPLFVALIVIEATDVIFAVDSIPAVFAVTKDAFVAFGSNILAILGLRALYFVISDWVKRLRYLKPGLAAILGFIGGKMLLVDLVDIPSWVSLLVIVSILTTAGLSSWYVGRLESKGTKNKM